MGVMFAFDVNPSWPMGTRIFRSASWLRLAISSIPRRIMSSRNWMLLGYRAIPSVLGLGWN